MGVWLGGRHVIGQKGTEVNEIIGGGFIGIHFTTVLVTQITKYYTMKMIKPLAPFTKEALASLQIEEPLRGKQVDALS